MLNYNEITAKKCIIYQGDPYEVIESHVARKQAMKPQNQTKLRNLMSGKILSVSFHAAEKVEEADIESKELKYLYTGKGESWFCDPKHPSDRFALKTGIMDGKEVFIKSDTLVTAMLFDEKVIGIKLPIKVELLVKEAAPAVRGNTISGGSKKVVLETGATINVPMFINEGDLLRINTETGEYAERVDKK